ncbi:MAG TPA: alpha/beta fold hydrolase [Allosphingosinicella sp.]|nr:alpha/beta fold hydrolase [Allosphingosinicella sp.]
MLRRETAGAPERTARALAGLRRYQEAPRRPPPAPMPVIAEAHGAKLRDYGGAGSGSAGGGTVLFVPSLINPPTILDLGEGKSLMRWLARRGHRPLLVDWGWEVGRRRSFTVADHVERILVPLIAGLDQPPAVVGYCLGGTMAVAAAALAPVRGLATIAAPWRFAAYPDPARADVRRLWEQWQPAARSFGMLPMEALQSAFWSLDPGRTVAKFEAFAGMAPGSERAAAFVTLEDWANDGPPIGEAAARDLFEAFFEADLPGSGGWAVAGAAVRPEALPCPLLNIVSTTDRIVPQETAIPAGERIELALGHVGMMVGGRAVEALWEPLAAWLSRGPAS